MKWMTQWTYAGAAVLALAGLTAFHYTTQSREPRPSASLVLSGGGPEDAVVQSRIMVKEEIARELVAGRLSLLQAAAGFRDLGLQGPPDMVRDAFPLAGSEAEAYCRSAIAYASSFAPAGQNDDLAYVLEAELHDRLQDGTLRLPDPDVDSSRAFPDSSAPRPAEEGRGRGNDLIGDDHVLATKPKGPKAVRLVLPFGMMRTGTSGGRGDIPWDPTAVV